MKWTSIVGMALMACWGAGMAQAQWLTQTLNLRAGWNAVYLHVDPGHVTIGEMVASDPSFAVEEVWMWRPDLTGQQFATSPLAPTNGDSRWLSWSRQEGDEAQLQRMGAGIPYLVRIKASLPTHSWQIKGRPVARRTLWTTSGLNFLGFPVPESSQPTFLTPTSGGVGFFSPGPADFLRVAEFYQYDGGDLGPNNPGVIFGLRTARMTRGEAYWIKSGDYYNRYFGPVEISTPESGRLVYGDKGRVMGLRIRNVTSAPLTVSLRLLPSESAPAGHPAVAGVVPLIVRKAKTNPAVLGHPYDNLDVATPRTWTLAASGALGSDAEIILGLDRSQLAGNAGDLFAGVLRFTDSLGISQVDVGVSANVGDYSGLWVGDALVSEVGQYLKKYQRNSGSAPVTDAGGKYQVQSLDTSLTGVASPFPLRLIVHNPSSGPATLLQQVYIGRDGSTNAIISRHEGALSKDFLRESRRISAPHLPFSTNNAGWSFSGPVAPGGAVTAQVLTRFNDTESSPFLHAYHPDHDNLDGKRSMTVPQGSESYGILRQLTLQFSPPDDDFESRTTAGESMIGTYAESVSIQGLARGGGAVDSRTFEARGFFNLNRISEVPTLTSATSP